jgi:hypothetical protein
MAFKRRGAVAAYVFEPSRHVGNARAQGDCRTGGMGMRGVRELGVLFCAKPNGRELPARDRADVLGIAPVNGEFRNRD